MKILLWGFTTAMQLATLWILYELHVIQRDRGGK